MCSETVCLTSFPLASRADASLRRMEDSAVSAAFWGKAALAFVITSDREKTTVKIVSFTNTFGSAKRIMVNTGSLDMVFFDDLKTGKDFCGRSKCCGNAAILLVRQFDCLSNCLCGNIMALYEMTHSEQLKTSRMFFAPLTSHFHTIIRNTLTLLF